MENVLVVAAHPDDELLGVGGTIRKLADQGICCRAVIVGEGISSRSDSRKDADPHEIEKLWKDARKAAGIIGYASIDFCSLPDNRLDGMELLDIIKILSHYIEQYQPDTVFTHHHGDLNIDHRVVCEAVLTTCRPVGGYCVERIYAFETPSSTEWNYTYAEPFTPSVYFDISKTLAVKLEGMQCYQSENASFPHPRSAEALSALAAIRGSNVGVGRAEGFMVLREIYR